MATTATDRAAPVDNTKHSHDAKIDLRRRVLEHVEPAHVFDAFCGLGEMYRGAWKDAASYVGCDERPWDPKDERRRFVADNRRVLRCLDLSAFNVFDFDAYGGPWEQLVILAARRRWRAGEVGAIVLTDGSTRKTRLGQGSHALNALIGTKTLAAFGVSLSSANDMADVALRAWYRRAGVVPRKAWIAKASAGDNGGMPAMRYTAVVFEGRGESSTRAS